MEKISAYDKLVASAFLVSKPACQFWCPNIEVSKEYRSISI